MTPPAQLQEAVARLRARRVVAFPTETVYGLGADAMNPAAVARVFALKGRPAHNPLIVHVADAAMARTLVRDWPDSAQRLASTFWPGPLTLVLPKSDRVLPTVTGGGPNVAVRAPDHPLALELLRAFGGPLVGPSANPSGRVSPTTAAHVSASFSEGDVLVLDGGPCRAGIESTVISLAGPPRILRPGVVTASEIGAVLGQRVEHAAPATTPAPLDSPGRMETHYSPTAPAVLFGPADWPAILTRAPRLAILTHTPRTPPPPHTIIPMPPSAAAYAARLYAALREADALSPDLIAIERPSSAPAHSPENPEIWAAILDRLTRATAPTPPNLLSRPSP